MYKKVDGETERVLLVPEGYVNWQINESTSSASSFIESGRGTNSPASSEAGGNDSFGFTRWQYYYRNGKLKEGDISVSCIQE